MSWSPPFTDAQLEAVRNALSDYVENGDCCDEAGADLRHLEPAREALALLDLALLVRTGCEASS